VYSTENWFTVQEFGKPVYSTSVQKTSLQHSTKNRFTAQYKKLVYSTSVQYRNWFSVQECGKPVHSTSVQKTSLQYKCTENQFTVQVYSTGNWFAVQVYTTENWFAVQVYKCTLQKTSLK